MGLQAFGLQSIHLSYNVSNATDIGCATSTMVRFDSNTENSVSYTYFEYWKVPAKQLAQATPRLIQAKIVC